MISLSAPVPFWLVLTCIVVFVVFSFLGASLVKKTKLKDKNSQE